MRILHTSDWHLGRITDKEPRFADHVAVLAEIAAIARDEAPDVIIHSGDLFDHPRPSYKDMVKASEVLRELAQTAPVVVICGNHDSPDLFRFIASWLGPDSRIRFVDRPVTAADGGILNFVGADGVELRLAVLPYVHPNRIMHAYEDANDLRKRYAERVSAMQQALAEELFRDLDPQRHVTAFAGHQYLSGADLARHSASPHVRDRYATEAGDIPKVGYAAFGDIHKPQRLPGAGVVGRYAGSPLELDFGELGEQKSVVIVNLVPGAEAEIRLVPLTAGRRLWRFKGTMDELRAVAPTITDQLCRLEVMTPTPDPTLSEQVYALLPNATILDIAENPEDRRLQVVEKEREPGAEPSLQDLFVEYLEEHGTSGTAAENVPPLFAALLELGETDDTTIPAVAQIEELLAKPMTAEVDEADKEDVA
ncbi:metallophosphoesterase family protein [Lentzea sp. NPDC004789]